jgi:hypothetical protein
MSKEMMICKLGHTIPLSSPICDDRCSDYHLRRGKCINLIPYIPEQPTTCPECGHPVSEHTDEGKGLYCHYIIGEHSCGCISAEPSNADFKHLCDSCIFCKDSENGSACEFEPLSTSESEKRGVVFSGHDVIKCPSYTPADLQPAEMPLVKNLITYPPDIAEALEVGKIRQQRADMAWHKDKVQQVRQAAVKEFAEKVSAYLKDALRIISPKTEDKVHAHIRAMAEE